MLPLEDPEQHAHALDAWLMDFKSSAVVPPALDAWARNANDLVREVARECAAAAPDAALAAFFAAFRARSASRFAFASASSSTAAARICGASA